MGEEVRGLWRSVSRAGDLALEGTSSSPGGAGYALLFHDNVIVKENFHVSSGLACWLGFSSC